MIDLKKKKKKQILSPVREKERKVLEPSANRQASHLLKRASGHQSHSQTVHWCLHGPQVQSDSRGCGGGTGWWSHPVGERSPLRLGSPQRRGGIGRSPACRREWTGLLPREILLWKDKCRMTHYSKFTHVWFVSTGYVDTRFDLVYISKVGCEGQMVMKSPDKE